jgi:CRP-like cAMP-binding protein
VPVDNKRIKNLLSTELFQGLAEEELVSLLTTFEEEQYSAGKIIFDTNTSGERVYLITAGAVRISRLTNYGDETTLDILQSGELFGELASLDGKSRSARVTAIEDTSLISFDHISFENIFRRNQRIASNLFRELSARIRKTDDNIVLRLEEQRIAIESRYQKLQNLIDASKSINSTLDLDKLLGLILDAATKSIGADRGTLYLVDDVKKELWSKILQGSNMIEIRLPVGKGLSGFVAEKGETILIPDTYADPRFNPEIDKQSGYRTRNMLCMPMKNKDGKLIGVFQLLNKKEGAFDAEDVNFIDAFSAHASVAIENARLAQEMVQNERLSAVGRMASVIGK